jgi:hypothetical protein
MEFMYWAYVRVFRCLRRTHKIFSTDYSKPMEVNDSKWLMVDAKLVDGTTIDVTEQIRDVIRSDAILTHEFLEKALRISPVESWNYLTKTLEYNKIPTQGVLNGL